MTPIAMRTLVAVCLLSSALSGQQAPDIEGRWLGTIDTSVGYVPVLLNVTRTADRYSATLNGTRLRGIVVRDDAVEFDMLVRSEDRERWGRFRGTVDHQRRRIAGTIPGTTFQVVLLRDHAPVAAPGVHVRVPAPPTAFRENGRTHLVYELRIVNSGPNDVEVKRIEVLGDSVLAAFTGGALKRLLSPTRIPAESADYATSTAYIWITLPTGAAVPDRLRHRLTIGDRTMDGPEVTVATEPVPVLGPPLHGDGWRAVQGMSNDSHHRRASAPGDDFLPARLAIDWNRLWPDGRAYRGRPQDNTSDFAYGAPTLAVADAVVATIKDGIPDNVPGRDSRAVPITRDTVSGNFISLDLGNGRYAMYMHLQPGSFRVRVGERVMRGQVLALVGNSGNSTGAHLHFQVVDRNSPLESQGVPYVIESFEVVKGQTYERRDNELPMAGDKVRFN